jgi:methyl coenzyme M reductase beta subunit
LYFPFKENDVLMMKNRLDALKPHTVYFSMNAHRAIRKFDAFTENAFDIEKHYVHGSHYKGASDSIFAIKLVHQFGRLGENGPIMEPCIPKAVESKRIELISVADGFNFYRINDPQIVAEFVREGILHPDYLTIGKLPQMANPFISR